MTYRVVSMFSGCGGMDLGFVGGFDYLGRRYARHPFEIAWANEWAAKVADVYAANFGDYRLRRGDVADHMDSLPPTADVVIGGFPCQDVTVHGRMTAERGERTVQYRYMVEAVRRTQPALFVAENVKGLTMRHGRRLFWRILRDFAALGYDVTYRVYDASEHGVPQTRERIFVVGSRCGEFRHPVPSGETCPTVADAIGDLAGLAEKPWADHVWIGAKRSSKYRRDGVDLPADGQAATVLHLPHWHYRLERRLSVREMARLQSFPDEFGFRGASRSAAYEMLGNAVPPVLAWDIARSAAWLLAAHGGGRAGPVEPRVSRYDPRNLQFDFGV